MCQVFDLCFFFFVNLIKERITLYFGLCPQIPYLQSNDEKNIRLISIEGHLREYLSSNPQNYQGLQIQGSLSNCYSKEKPWRHDQ